MSILQEYESHKDLVGTARINAIEDYIKYYQEKYNKDILYSDIMYKKSEYELFDNWFNNYIEPMKIVTHSNNIYSLIVSHEEFDKYNLNKYTFTGYEFEDLIKKHIDNKLPHLISNFNFDSENGMFALSSNSLFDIEELAYSFTKETRNKDYIKSLTNDKDMDL